MLAYLTVIFVCQLTGELLVALFALPIPGPVAGMVFLFCGLLLRGHLDANLASVGDSLLRHLSLLFVPAGVGVMLHLRLLGDELLPIAASVLVSTVLTIVVTGWLMSRLGSDATSRPGKVD